jgi:L-fuculose-phosphate aldolase
MLSIQEIINCGSRLRTAGLIVATQGNISLRREDGSILITRSGADKGQLQRQDVLTLSAAGDLYSRTGSPSSETQLHLSAYRRLPDIGAVIHAHPPCATSFAASGRPLPQGVLAEIEDELGEIPLLPWALPGSPDLAATLERVVTGQCAFLLANHGALTVGVDLEQATRRMELLEFYARVVLGAGQLGGPTQLPVKINRRQESK